jgi:Beta-lactamase
MNAATAALAISALIAWTLGEPAAAAPRAAPDAAMVSSQRTAGPWPMSAFAPPPNAAAPRRQFEGRLRLTAERAERGFDVIVDRFGDAKAHRGAAAHLPPFDFAFIQDGAALIPVRRGAIPSTHPEWEFILEPGRVWDDAADGEFSRAAVPFALEERNANCLHQGVMSFRFRADGAISDVSYEIAHETCAYFQFTLWGSSQALYTPQKIADRGAIIRHYRDEVNSRLPVRPMSALPAAFPGANPANFGSAAEISPASMSVYGLVVQGVHYRSDCGTRFGPYPFCDVLDLPSYSLAKSLLASVTVMRLVARYPELPAARIADFVPECAGRNGWQDVTFANALDMATGHFESSRFEADEDSLDMVESFFIPDTHAAKIRFACSHYPRRAPPGSLWAYHTADTYLLGTALNAFYRTKNGPGADFYRDLLAGGLWPALRLSPALYVTRRTYDDVQQPFTGFGLTLHSDDIARLATFLNLDHGRIAQEQMLDPGLLDEALQRDPHHPGLRAGSDVLRYNLGFWAWNVQATLGCRAETWIPFMSGYGGIVVALLPNGMTYYYVSDGAVFRWAAAAAEANRMKSFCRR